ncbi:MAG: bifunctional 5,10-methylenetetrahydrofolate dehydrogenase/5,10-methenyltetrahydrofolate cyclohydrolase [Candidatus Omnitrophota bacterium]|jgi:methylenetetrahydrofolate dehydrogenase (NADP+)/methenyltetrahydrofolate cyclohydrolase
MAAILLEGKPVAEKIREALLAEISALMAGSGKKAKLVAIEIGENAASAVYVKNQKKAAETLGIEYELKALPADVPQGKAEDIIKELNADDSVTAIILQFPVPKSINANKLINKISPEKDAEGVHPRNMGNILSGNYRIGPCTAMAVMELLRSSGVDLYGKEAVVVGHSDIVGKPLALMLLNKFVTTCVCHIATGERGNLSEHVKRAELLIVAVGKAGLIKGEWIREGAIVIDVGINRVGEKLVGDVEFDKAAKAASMITPVPGGVGPLTTTMLMRNVVELFKNQHSE